MRIVSGCLGAGTAADGEHHRDGSGGGLQLNVVQPRPGEGDIPPAFLYAFVRELIRNTVSGDALQLAMYAAQDAVSVTPEQLKQFSQAVFGEKNQRGYFPKRF